MVRQRIAFSASEALGLAGFCVVGGERGPAAEDHDDSGDGIGNNLGNASKGGAQRNRRCADPCLRCRRQGLVYP